MLRPTFFHIEDIRSDVNADYLPDDIDITDVKYFANQTNRNDIENKGLALTILRCMPGEASTKSQYAVQDQKKLSRFMAGKPYHRWFLCADLANPPHCFALITDNLSHTNRLLIHNLDDTYIGRCFYLVEPNMSKDKQGHYLHIIRCQDIELLPLEWDARVLSRPAKIKLPPSSEETFYFSLFNQSVNLHRIRAPTDPSCMGFQCNHQGKRGKCLCLNLVPGSPLVYSFDIEFDVDPRVFKHNTYVADGFILYRTTTVFFQKLCRIFKYKHHGQRAHRQAMIQTMVEYINSHGRWTIVGWCRKGRINVEGESKRVDNTEVKLNISYLYPADPNILRRQDFITLQITTRIMTERIMMFPREPTVQRKRLMTPMRKFHLLSNNERKQKRKRDCSIPISDAHP